MVMTKYAKILAILVGLGLYSATFAENPIIQTYYSPDPAPVVFGDTVCVYSGNDEGGSFFTMNGWRVSCSTDMVNWTDRGTLILSSESFGGSAKKNDDWAAQVIRRNNKYYYYVTVGDPNAGGSRSINVAVADKPEGPFKDALNGNHLAGPNWDYIDPTVWIDDNGQAYLYFGNPTLYWAKLKEDMITLDGEVHKTTMTEAGFGPKYCDNEGKCSESAYVEGPWIHKRNGTYYMIYASHGVPEKISYSTSSSPTGPWTFRGVIMDQGNGTAFTNHSGIIDFKGRSFFFYHNQKNASGGGCSRSTAVEEFTWNADGSIPTIESTDNGVVKPIHNLNPFERVEAETKSWVGGITVDKSNGYTIIRHVDVESGNVYLTGMSSGFYTKVRSVDMDAGADRIVVCTRGNAGKLELHTESTTGPLLASMDIPASSKWQENTFELSGAEGIEDLYFVVKSGTFDFDYWFMETDRAPVVQAPYKGVAANIPGTIEAENYDEGGHNKSFYDADRDNQGNAYRQDEVDVVGFGCSDEANTKDCKIYAIGYTQEDEWLEYTVNVVADAKYDITANVATPFETAGLQLFIDDEPITESITGLKTDEEKFDVYKEMELGSVELKKGTYVLKLLITGTYLNVDWIKFTDPNNPNSIRTVRRGVNLAPQAGVSYDVFSVSGKHLGCVNGRNLVVHDMSVLLGQAGYANGIYLVRSKVRGGSMMQKVIVKGK